MHSPYLPDMGGGGFMVLGGCMVLGDAWSWGLHGPRVDDLSGPGGGGACSQGCVVCLFQGGLVEGVVCDVLGGGGYGGNPAWTETEPPL